MKFARPVLFSSSIAAVCLSSALLAYFREGSSGGPQHDEVIAMMAAKGLEGEYARLAADNLPPFDRVVPASTWHEFTQDFSPVPFRQIWDDVRSNDLHPPLAFWLFNRWLSCFPSGDSSDALILVWLQVIVAAAVLAWAVFRQVNRANAALLAFTLFLAGDSAVFTATWARQYGLLAICYCVVMAVSAEVVRTGLSSRGFGLLVAVLGLACLLGMLTQYTFFTMSAPIHLAILSALFARRMWAHAAILGASYALTGACFCGCCRECWIMRPVV